jgi:hypothetical protein
MIHFLDRSKYGMMFGTESSTSVLRCSLHRAPPGVLPEAPPGAKSPSERSLEGAFEQSKTRPRRWLSKLSRSGEDSRGTHMSDQTFEV